MFNVNMTTTASKNVFNIAINGNFDDCQNYQRDVNDKYFQKK